MMRGMRYKTRIKINRKKTSVKRLHFWLPFFIGVFLGAGFCLQVTHIITNSQDLTTVTSSFIVPTNATPSTSTAPSITKMASDLRPRRQLYVGVMTTGVFLDTRALAVHRTWGQDSDRIEYFTGSFSGFTDPEMSIVLLKGIGDTEYPPRKKSLRMLSYICQHHIDKFHWFMRADDDLYIKMDKLLEFLQKLEKGEMVYLGQEGRGVPEERPVLKLEDYNFCMGGPGILFSRNLLQALCPYLPRCEREAVSTHEDVEMGRCIQRHLGIRCTSSHKLSTLFFHAHKNFYPNGVPFMTGLDSDVHVKQAITIHYAKKPEIMYNLRQQHLGEMIKQETQKIDKYKNMLEHLEAIKE